MAAISETVTIESKKVGAGHPTFLIAEIAQAHDGSLGTAHAYIDAVAKTGATAIKFQTHIAHAESTPGEPFRIKFSRQDATRYGYWRRMEFTPEQWSGLALHARESGLIFLSTPFSLEAADLLEKLQVAAWKIGSGEVSNNALLEKVAKTGKPVLLSSGLSSWVELDRAVDVVKNHAPVALFQCTSEYPCPPKKVGLNVLKQLRERYGCPVGLSDHSATVFAGLGAVALGANLLEVHVTLSRDAFGPDVPASLTTAELAELSRGTRFLDEALSNPVDKDAHAASVTEMKRIFEKSLVAACNLPAGHVLREEDLAFKKPGTGIPVAKLQEVLGRTLTREVRGDTLLQEDDLE